MQIIEFYSHSHQGTIAIPNAYPDWHDQPIKVILWRDEPTVNKPPRPIGLARDRFQVSPRFFEELPAELVEAFEGKQP
jgi:hypothetical protein